MKNDFLSILQRLFENQIFTDKDLKIVFFNRPKEQIHNSLSYHMKQGNIQKLKRGFYLLKKSKISKYKISNQLYNPSYISFASALSFHHLIPEAVYETTAACFLQKVKDTTNEFGVFSYRHIPVSPFFLDVNNPENGALIASPLRALLDTVYSDKKKYESLDELELDLRIDLTELGNCLLFYSASDILKLGELYKTRPTRNMARLLIGKFK